MNRGKLVIVVMFAVSAGMASFAVWYQHVSGRYCMEYWGADSAIRIQNADRVHQLTLTKVDEKGNQASDRAPESPLSEGLSVLLRRPPPGEFEIPLDGVRFRVVQQRDISSKPGLQHLQRALVEDRTFDWNSNRSTSQPNWNYLLIFTNRSGQSIIAIDLNGGWIRKVSDEKGSPGNLDAAQIEKFLRYFFAPEQ